jgi:putative nucleotidyltransferase with HDIG domain
MSKSVELFENLLPENWDAVESNVVAYKHSMTVAEAARAITSKIPGFDQEKAFNSGLLHDVGKFHVSEKERYKHPRIGYEILRDTDRELGNVCISHPFPIFEYHDYILHYCKNDLEELAQISELLTNVDINNYYINLIQFCDKISEIDTYTSLENKFQWYRSKCGVDPEFTRPNYLRLVEIKNNLDELANCDVYTSIGAI